jgi:hypothetical protein
MSLLNQYVLNHGQMGAFFDRIRDAQAPSKFTHQFLKDIGFTSSNYRAYVPLLKGLGFLSEDGSPKSEYMQLLDPTQWRVAIANSLRRSYSDIFVLKAKPTKADKAAIIGKYKTTYNVNELSAERATNTFLALLDLADEAALYSTKEAAPAIAQIAVETPPVGAGAAPPPIAAKPSGKPPLDLCYNIQIHLPPTKDVEVYNAIFKALREHFVD